MSFGFLATAMGRSIRPRVSNNLDTVRGTASVQCRPALTHFGHIEVRSSGFGRPILIVPGLWGGAELLKPLIDSLARNFRVHWFDWPGESLESHSQTGRNVLRPEAILAEAIRATGESSLTVFGHSFGAYAAIKALSLPLASKIERLLITGAGACDVRRPTDLFLNRLTAGKSRIDSGDPLLPAFAKTVLGDAENDPVKLARIVSILARTSPTAITMKSDWLRRTRYACSAPEYDVPVTMLAAERDAAVPFESQRRLAESLCANFAPLPGTGHMGVMTHAEQFSLAIESTILAGPKRARIVTE
jgi:pimeloyl-ACP methyl ester carboxylesterase